MTKQTAKKKEPKKAGAEKKRAPEPDQPKQRNWRDLMSQALEKKRPAEGFPDPKSKYDKPNQPKKR